MKQRVGFARALAVEPEILFMDEPFSALDVLTAENLRGELLELWLAKKIPTRSIFIVTHNIEEAVLLADRIIVLGRNPAKIRADFRVPLHQPRDRKSAGVSSLRGLHLQSNDAAASWSWRRHRQPSDKAKAAAADAAACAAGRRRGLAGTAERSRRRRGHVPHRRGTAAGSGRPAADHGCGDAARLRHGARRRRAHHGRRDAHSREADIPTRKDLFREAVLAHVSLLQQIQTALEKKSDHTMPLEFFRDMLDEHFAAGWKWSSRLKPR